MIDAYAGALYLRKNVLRGRKNKAAGDRFEAFLEIHHARALDLGILAHIEKTEPKAKYIHKRLTYVEKSCADYVGTLDRSGLTVAIEAKSRTGRLYKKDVSPKQQKHLTAVANAGGVALLAVEYSIFKYIIPWLEVPWNKARSVDSLEETIAIAKYRLQPTEHCYLARFALPGAQSTPQKRKQYRRD